MTAFTKIVLQFLVPIVLILIVITQIILPIFIPDLEMFWLFRKGGKNRVSVTDEDVPDHLKRKKSDLDEEVDRVAQQMSKEAQRLKDTRGKVDQTINKLNNAKNDSLNNLNND